MATQKDKPKGYFKYLLALDAETSGMFYNQIDPSTDGKDFYQSISWGFIVADSLTLKPVDEVYIVLNWDGKSLWNQQAQDIHGLSKTHLAEHGVSYEEGATELFEMLLKYWGPDSVITTLGHNHVMFDLYFMRRWLEPLGVMPKISHRNIDTNALGFVGFQSYSSDELFHKVGLPERDPKKHNALTDAAYALETARRFRSIFNSVIEG